MNLQELATTISAELDVQPPMTGETAIVRCASLEDAGEGDVSFLSNPKYASQINTTKASAIIVAKNVKLSRTDGHRPALLRAADPYFAFRNAMVAINDFRQHPHPGIHPGAYVDPTATVGEGTVIYPGCYVGPNAKIGKDCILYPNVVVYDECVLGDRVTLHACCSIGHDGFGYATHALPGQAPAHHKIPQAGNVVIEDDVEMGAGCTVDRATLGSTVIGKGTKFSNLVAIGHGCKIGKHNLYVAQVGLAGSVITGDYVVMGGQAGVAGHLKIGNQVQVSGRGAVIDDVPDKTTMLGAPAMPSSQARRVYNHFMNLDAIFNRIKDLEKKVEVLEGEKTKQ